MILLTESGELVVVNIFSEPSLYKDENIITAVKTIEELTKEYKSPHYNGKSEIRQLTFDSSGKLNWKVIQCQYNDQSSLGHWYMQFDTKGEAIRRMQKDGYTVYLNDKVIENPEKLRVIEVNS